MGMGKKSGGLFWSLMVDLPPSKVTELHDAYRLNSALLRLQLMSEAKPSRRAKRAVAGE